MFWSIKKLLPTLLSPLDESNKLFLELLLLSSSFEVFYASQIIYNIPSFPKIYLVMETSQTYRLSSLVTSDTSCKELRIFISISSIMRPVFVT